MMSYLSSVRVACPDNEFPFSIPAIRDLEGGLALHPKVTFLVGENGMGKSTLLEGLADKWGFSEESGSRTKGQGFGTYHTRIAPEMTLSRDSGKRARDGFFLRAESFYNFATEMDELEKEPYCATGYASYGGKSLHRQSHGESFFSLFLYRFGGRGFYLLDEPEAALSPRRQMAFLVRLHDLVEDESQFVIATHSPIILAYPEATIYELSAGGLREVSYRECQPYEVTSRFLREPEAMVKRLLEE